MWSNATCCCCLVAKSCLTLCDSMDYSSPGSSVHGISQARILERVAIAFSRNAIWWVFLYGKVIRTQMSTMQRWDTQWEWPSTSQEERSLKKPTVPTFWSWTFTIQNCEKIYFCCSHCLVFVTLSWQTQQTYALPLERFLDIQINV